MQMILSVAVVLAIFAAVEKAQAAQSATYTCAKHVAGTANSIVFAVTSTGTNYVIKSLVGEDAGGAACSPPVPYPAGPGTSYAFQVSATDGSPLTGSTTPALPCGVVVTDNAGVKTYTITFVTSSCDQCLINEDLKYIISCDFESALEQDAVTTGTAIGGTIGTGTANAFNEIVAMDVMNEAGDAPIPVGGVNLGTKVKLQVTLSKKGTGFATGVSLHTCGAMKTANAASLEVTMMAADGCTPAALGILTENTGFKKTSSDVNNYVTQSNAFPAFIFFGANGNSLFFKCTAKFCFGVDATCDTSCAAELGKRRRRRAADEDEEMDVVVYMRVSTDNRTHVSVLPARGAEHHDNAICSNRSYIIGLAILGCVLILTLIVTVGIFVLFHRSRHGNNHSEKFGYENKCAS